ncbi:response regulator [bacterium]|nr:response regulator [bacterium]
MSGNTLAIGLIHFISVSSSLPTQYSQDVILTREYRLQVGYPSSDPVDPNEPRRAVALVVEDETETREVIAAAVENYGFRVVQAGDGIQAYRQFEREKPSIVISDIYLPYTNGIVLMNKIKVRAPRLPIILITGYSHYRQLLQGSRFPPDGFLAKPFTVDELYTTMNRVLGVSSESGFNSTIQR